jgi:hypothetical protein
MKRALLLVLSVVLLSACASAQTTQPAGQTQPPGQTQLPTAGGASGTSLVDAAAKVTDVCTLMPADLAATLVPGGSAPQSEQFPSRCTVSNGTAALQITISVYDSVEPPQGAESVPGLAEGAYFEPTGFLDDAYLKIVLSKNGGALYVEMAGHDGKDHKDDAIAVAQAVIAKLR